MSGANASGSSASGPSTRPRPAGTWQPLPYIYSGFCVYPYQPESTPPGSPTSPTDTVRAGLKNRNRFSWSGVRSSTEHEGEEGNVRANAYEIPLDIGDEFFAFEEYRCHVEEDGRGDVWYRGYLVQAVSLPSLIPSSSTSLLNSSSYPRPEPSVLLGIFPATAVHIRPGNSADDGQLSEAYARAVKLAEDKNKTANPSWLDEMGTLKEEDEAEGHDPSSPQRTVVDVSAPIGSEKSDKIMRRTSVGKSSGLRPNRPESLILESKSTEIVEDKEQPPLPKLTAGEATIAGQEWPLIDEIACAIREWHARLPTYLANRKYRLFHTVMQHIDALFLGRRQLLSQTLSEDELVRVRRECVSRLVKCNVAQGLDVIVRSLVDGSVMVVDKERAFSGTDWVGGINCYVYQVQLAYIDLIPLDNLFGRSSRFVAHHANGQSSRSSSLAAAKVGDNSSPSPTGTHYHCLLDVRAFIASPCSAGETSELYFSLYSKTDSRFVTEEFCLVLNHLGTPARDGERRLGRLRTLFTELKHEDLARDVYLVCRIVRNGAMKMRQDSGSVSIRPNPSKRSSLYGLTEGRSSNFSRLDASTEDSFSVTSGYGGQNASTADMSFVNGERGSLDGRAIFRRPLGCAVLPLPALQKLLVETVDKGGPDVEFNVPIYLPREESAFATLHEHIIHRNTGEYGTSSRAEAIASSLKVFHGSAPMIMREHPSLLHDVPMTSRLGFPDVVFPGTMRNDLYIKLWSAVFAPRPGPTNGSIRVRKSVMPVSHGDVQISFEVRQKDGTIVPDVMFPGGSGEPAVSTFHSLVFHRTDRPTYGELVKLSLPSNIPIEGLHLYVVFRSRGKDRQPYMDPYELEKPFAFAYLPLSQQAGALKDGDYELNLYQAGANPSPPTAYLKEPAIAQAGMDSTSITSRDSTLLRDRVTLRTYLCSNTQTQDSTLRSLLAWPEGGSDIDTLSQTLRLFSFVSEEEIAKFLPSILDALFSIMVSDLGERQKEVDSLIFKSIIKVLTMSFDRRFPNFRAALDIYVDKQFSFPSISHPLMAAMTSAMANPKVTENRAFIKVWHLIFRFIVRSRDQERARGPGPSATSERIAADFQEQTRHLLKSVDLLMQSDDPTLIGTQTLAVQHYGDILPDLGTLFPPLEVAELLIAFVDTLTFATGSIAVHKLLLILQVVRGTFESSDTRALLVPAIVRWIKPHLGSYEAALATSREDSQAVKDGKRIKWLEGNRLATTVLAWTVDKLQEWHGSATISENPALQAREADNLEYCLTLLPCLFESYSQLSSPDTLAVLHRQRSISTSAIWKATPDVFPMAYPFTLISELPPISLLERHQDLGEDALPSFETFNCGLAENAVVILTLISASPRDNVRRWLVEVLDIEGISSLSATLRSTFDFCRSIVRFEAFPRQWLTLSLMCFSSIIKLIDIIADIMVKPAFIPPAQDADSFNVALWSKLFQVLCEICGSKELALEDQTHQRRRAEWIIAGDLRDQAAELLMRLWSAIGWPVDGARMTQGGELRYGGYQTTLTGLAETVLRLCLSSHDLMCETAVEILFSMIYAEYMIEGKFETIEKNVFAQLEHLFSSKSSANTLASSDPAMRAYFVAQLRAVFESSPEIDETFTNKVSGFLDEIELFIDLLLSLRDIPDTAKWAEERASATYRLMTFVEGIGRPDLYIRFLYQLLDIAMDNRDWLAAGLALKMHADSLAWNVGGDLLAQMHCKGIRLPPQNMFARKEALYYHAIQLLVKAEAYEFALVLCQELTIQYQSLTFNVEKLSDLLTYQAKLWEGIASSTRPKPEYFRVAYYGDWPIGTKDKDYIVRGQPWQRYSEFCDTLHTKHPQATLHRSKLPPADLLRHSQEQLIWVVPLTPEPDTSRPVFADGVNLNVQAYYLCNGITEFSSSRPYLRDPEDAQQDVILTWIEKTVLTAAAELPGLLSRSEVVNVRYEQVSPVGNAIAEVGKATKSLRRLCSVRDGQLPGSKLLGTAINGAVDSPVSGGVQTYQRVFLDRAYVEEHPEFTNEVEMLRSVILDYVSAIRDSLITHKAVCKDVAFHEALRTHFHKTYAKEIALLPPLPVGSTGSSLSLSLSASRSTDARRLPFSSSPGGSQGHSLPALPLDRSGSSLGHQVHNGSPGRSTRHHESSYRLPELTLAPAVDLATALSIQSSTSTPRESTSTHRHPASSHGHETETHDGSIRNGERRSSLNTLSRSGSSSALGARAMSFVGLAGKNDSNPGTISELGERSDAASVRWSSEQRRGSANEGHEVKKEKGMRRFGSLMRRGQ
ncbi:hypothetical protein IAU60_004808 [Kwoniella sp. DSM 27419]